MPSKRFPLSAAVAALSAALSAAVMAPMLRGGLRPVDSYNSTWIDSFSAALARGEWAPHWMPEAFDGMGASSFYFYPPLAFYFSSLVDALSGRTLSAELIAAWSGFGLSVLSSVTMYAWLRSRAGALTAVGASLVYALAPYHLIDLFGRGSFGELVAYPILPLFALAFERATRRLDGVPLLAAAYAGLILSHIAIGLTVGVFAAPVLLLGALVRAGPQERPGIILRVAAGGLLGVGLAATYLAPAMGLQGAASMQWMWGSAADAGNPANWALFNTAHWPSPPLAQAMSGLACVYGVAAAACLPLVRREGRAWAAVVLVALVAYAVPALWQGVMAPVLGKVQFPFRMLVFMEFALISAVAMARPIRARIALAAAALVVSILTPFSRQLLWSHYVLARGYPANADPVIAERIRHVRAPEEHLPKTFNFDPKIVVSRVYLDGFAGLPPMRALDPRARIVAASEYPDGSVVAVIDAPSTTRVVVRRFYFPAWRASLVASGADPAMPTGPYGPSRFLSFEARPGRHMYRAHIVRTPVEKLGDAISTISLLAALALGAPALRGRLGRRPHARAAARR